VTYSTGVSSPSPTAQAILNRLVARLEKGALITVTGYAYDNRSLARKRAMVVLAYLERRIDVHITVREVLSSKVGKVIVVTTKL
jgi:outer membrane protein OmpA-like peptidoglycan-associated protein